ncbi:hypothetical protein ERX37_09020 [Macrococcus hajekii]|uniref:Immunodominant staphylococcal antigen B n=1 Tax=Macrococcus hajekii TaxID=198482 RepID=A0A4V3BDX2_9STAP|nr:hypothetical protein [Macrococcus hajekii]TDM01624.1 hypothetical protein ERX37_09020 [Macrococcus hajekii]GGB01589.1 hypothetical protein GCM10007190_07070 [Macrococcus hajekii]
MYKWTKMLGAGMLASAIVTGTVVAEQPAQAKTETAQKPYYNYKGYTQYDGKFVTDKYFVTALKSENFTLNGYQVAADAKLGKEGQKSKVYDTTIVKDNSGKVSTIEFPVKKGTIAKADFIKAHKDNKLVRTTTNKAGETFLKYETKNGGYFAAFDSKGYLTVISIYS